MRAYGNLINRIGEMAKPKEPVVGDGVTVYCYSDRQAYTVAEVLSPTRILIRRDKAIRTDTRGMSDSQSYRYEEDPAAPEQELRLNKRGQWKLKGDPQGSTYVIGIRNEHYDYSF